MISSSTIPVPPFTFLSIKPMGKGFIISKIRNRIKPAMILVQEMGIKNSVINIPATSSITIDEASWVLRIFEAAPEIGMEKINIKARDRQ